MGTIDSSEQQRAEHSTRRGRRESAHTGLTAAAAAGMEDVVGCGWGLWDGWRMGEINEGEVVGCMMGRRGKNW
jgi:hypothetical protein